MITKKRGGQGEEARRPVDPRVTLELVGGNQLRVSAEWEKGADLDLFAHLLLFLCQGKLAAAISAAVTARGMATGELDKALAVHLLLKGGVEVEDEPLIRPTQAIQANMKPFQG